MNLNRKIFLAVFISSIGTVSLAQPIVYNYTQSYDKTTGLTLTNSNNSYKSIKINQNYFWKSKEVSEAQKQGFWGQGVTIHNYDWHYSTLEERREATINGKTVLVSGAKHGDFTASINKSIAPRSTVLVYDLTTGNPNKFYIGQGLTKRVGLNIVNLSLSSSGISPELLNAGTKGTHLIVKAAGNDKQQKLGSILEDSTRTQADFLRGKKEGIATALRLSNSTLFVGALNRNGNLVNKSELTSYTNIAGDDPEFQKRYLMAAVDSRYTGINGTSFSTPIVAGYAAILGSKFKTATPTQIANQLLKTARKDTINNYNIAVHGQGEASIARAIAPISIK